MDTTILSIYKGETFSLSEAAPTFQFSAENKHHIKPIFLFTEIRKK